MLHYEIMVLCVQLHVTYRRDGHNLWRLQYSSNSVISKPIKLYFFNNMRTETKDMNASQDSKTQF